MKATQQLRDEHEGIKLMLGILGKVTSMGESGQELNLDHVERVLEFFRIFVDKCHHGKEEDLLFPQLEKHGFSKEEGPIQVMLSEHGQGRNYIQAMAHGLSGLRRETPEALKLFIENASGYMSLLTQHISK